MERTIENIIADNLVALRKAKNLKQIELAEQIGYSDKTISRWENGSTLPDIATLAKLAEFYNIKVDDLINEDAVDKSLGTEKQRQKEDRHSKLAMLLLAILTIWLFAVIVYVAIKIINNYHFWQAFVWAVPPCALLAFRYNVNYDNIRWLNTVLLSVFAWGIIIATYLQLLDYQLWPLFLLPVPVEGMIVIYTLLRKPRKRRIRERLSFTHLFDVDKND